MPITNYKASLIAGFTLCAKHMLNALPERQGKAFPFPTAKLALT